MGKANSKLSPEVVQDLQKSTYCNTHQFFQAGNGFVVDKKEIQTWYRSFIRECPNGLLRQADLLEIYRQFFPFGDPSSFCEHVFRLYDTKGDGVIDFGEYIRALSITSRGKLEEKIQWAFKFYDIDGDGMISKDDMLVIVEAIYRMIGSMIELPEDENTPMKRVEKIFSTMNKNEDDVLTLEEFREGAQADPSVVQGLLMYDGIV